MKSYERKWLIFRQMWILGSIFVRIRTSLLGRIGRVGERDVFAEALNLGAQARGHPKQLARLVRMSELNEGSQVLTTDSDFRIYRRFGRKVIPAILPA